MLKRSSICEPALLIDLFFGPGRRLADKTSERYNTCNPPRLGAFEMTTKELLDRTGISEATLRRWLRDGQPVPELADARRDWRGWREWDERHATAILTYKAERLQSLESVENENQLALFRRPG